MTESVSIKNITFILKLLGPVNLTERNFKQTSMNIRALTNQSELLKK